jgi:hypothetical protein
MDSSCYLAGRRDAGLQGSMIARFWLVMNQSAAGKVVAPLGSLPTGPIRRLTAAE